MGIVPDLIGVGSKDRIVIYHKDSGAIHVFGTDGFKLRSVAVPARINALHKEVPRKLVSVDIGQDGCVIWYVCQPACMCVMFF